MKPSIILLAAFAASALPSAAAIIIYNQDHPPSTTSLPSGGWGNYKGFGFNYSDPKLSVGYTVPDDAPLATTLLLTDLTVRRAGTSSGTPIGNPSNVLIKVYSSQTPTTGTWVGDSATTGNMAGGIAEENVSFSFGNLELSDSTTYWFYFANADETGNLEIADITFASGRLRVSNHADHTYDSGNLVNGSAQGNWSNQDIAYDAVFSATFAAIPEPSVISLAGLATAALLRRRRH